MKSKIVHKRLSELEAHAAPKFSGLELFKKACSYDLFGNYETGEIIGWEEYRIVHPKNAEILMKNWRSRGGSDEEFSAERTRIEPELFRVLADES